MKKVFFCFILQLFYFVSYSQSTSISGIINSYASVTAISCQSINVNSTSGFNAGDRVMLIQMKGAVIDSSNTTAFGTILNYKNAGNYELATISSINANTINLVDSVLKKYTISGIVQLIKVPVYADVTIVGNLTCQSWNGSTGGVLALIASGKVILNADVDVSGKGFLGGALSNGNLVSCQGDTADYMSSTSSLGSGRKGEGIVLYNSMRTNGKGPNGNGGGGGTDCNGGGAGGGNYGKGGHGGDSECNVSCPPYFYQNSGGYPGDNLSYSNLINKIFLGGGGGAGHQNNSVGTAGATGGGIVLIKADSIFGNNNYIRSDGINNTVVAGNDGQGGGGAGGTILLRINGDNTLKASVQGGYGGVDNFNGTDCHGKGGGGAGGIIWTFKPINTITMFFNGGAPGIFTYPSSNCYNTGNGATAGQNGIHIIDLIIPESTAPCVVNDIKVFENNNTVTIFPNPFSSSITIKTSIELKNAMFTIYDVLGNEMKSTIVSGQEIKINTGNLSAGFYSYRLMQNKKLISTGKLIAE